MSKSQPISNELIKRIVLGLETPESLEERQLRENFGSPDSFRSLMRQLDNKEQLDEVDFKKAAAGLGAAAAIGAGAGAGDAKAQGVGDWINLAKNVAGAVQQASGQAQTPQAPAQKIDLQPGQSLVVKVGPDYADANEATPDYNKFTAAGMTLDIRKRANGAIYFTSKNTFSTQDQADEFIKQARSSGAETKLLLRNPAATQQEPARQAQAEPPRQSAQTQAQPQRVAAPQAIVPNTPDQLTVGTSDFKMTKAIVKGRDGSVHDFSKQDIGIFKVTARDNRLSSINWEGKSSETIRGQLTSSKTTTENGKEIRVDVYESQSSMMMGQNRITTNHQIFVNKVAGPGGKITILARTTSSNGSQSEMQFEMAK
jgi:uncharacterized protein YfiM (DUF2279 family)